MNNYEIHNLVKGCEILSVLADRPEGISAIGLEKLVGVPKTTAFRILKTLCSQEMAEKRGTLFFAGPGLIQIGLNSLRSLEIRSLSIPFLSELAAKTHFTAHLAIPSGWQSLILEVHDSPNPVRVASRSGTTVPFYCSSTGKIFLAYRFEQELEDYFSATSLQKHTDNTIVTLPEMLKEVEQIKSDGFAVDNHEFHTDVWCTAAPIRDSLGQVVAAIGVTSPASQSDRQKRTDTCASVKKAAEELSAVLGFNV
ncbi:MAG: IclR family transcriptional regulator [Planctomycetes bacterium]|nr:IclR family transcriptional regulator [Planctomycetota bacterium]